MMQVRETSAGKSISAYVVLNKKGRHVATVQAHYSNGGVCTVNVWNNGDDACKRSAEAMGYVFDADGKVVGNVAKGKPDYRGQYAYKVAGFQAARAGGGGYDKFTAALSGLIIDGHVMTDHCGAQLAPPKGRLWQDSDKARLARKGYKLNNYSQGVAEGEPWPASRGSYGRAGVPNTESGYVNAYRMEGTQYLEALGYRVFKAI